MEAYFKNFGQFIDLGSSLQFSPAYRIERIFCNFDQFKDLEVWFSVLWTRWSYLRLISMNRQAPSWIIPLWETFLCLTV